MTKPYQRLGINIDHVATVRNARGGVHPDPIRAALLARDGGADGITAHLREDRRHIRDDDIARIATEMPLPLGLHGALIIAPRDPPSANYDITVQLQEWLKREWLTYPAMLMEGGLPNFFTINGKSYPATERVRMRVGETLKVRFIGSSNNFIHPMHIHGGPFEVVAIDGETLQPSARFLADTVNVGPGQRFDVIWTARRPGKWLLHCHIPHHAENNNVEVEGAGGLTMIIDVAA